MSKTKQIVTRIHGKYYDLTDFQHPGGPQTINLAADRDATEIWESYHQLTRTRAWAVLSKYEMKEPSSMSEKNATHDERFRDLARFGEEAAFDWSNDRKGAAFRDDIVAEATAYFEGLRGDCTDIALAKYTKAPWHRNFMSLCFLAAFYTCCYHMFVYESWLAMFAAPFVGWLLVANYWHDALHFALSADWRVNKFAPYLFPYFMIPFIWFYQHTIGHHVHTNDPERDPDMNFAPKILRFSAFKKLYPMHRFQKYRLWMLFLWSLATSTLKPLLRDHMTRMQGWHSGCVPLVFPTPLRKNMHIAGRFVVLFLMGVWPYARIFEWTLYSFFKAHCFAWIPSMTLSAIFVANAQINHLNEENEHSNSQSSDFFIHQAQTSTSFSTGSYLAFFLTGGLNLQIEHHLLPGVNHWHLFKMSSAIRHVCAKHGVVYTHRESFTEAFQAHLKFNESLAVREQKVRIKTPVLSHASRPKAA